MQLFADLPPTQINTDSGEAGPQVTVLANGNYVVVWDDAKYGRLTARHYELHVDVFDAAGALVKSSVVDASPQINHDFPDPLAQVVALDDGGFAIAWHRSTGSSTGSAAQTFDASGDATSAIISVTGSIYGQSLAPLANGGFALGWSQLSPSGAKDAYAATFDSNGQVSATTQLSQLTGSAYVDSPVLVSLPNGYAVSWTAALNAQTADIYMAVFDVNGQMIGAPIEVSGPFNTSIHTETQGRAAFERQLCPELVEGRGRRCRHRRLQRHLRRERRPDRAARHRRARQDRPCRRSGRRTPRHRHQRQRHRLPDQ